MSQQTLTERAIFVLANLATFTDDVTNEHPERHALRLIKNMVSAHLELALREAQDLMEMKTELRSIVAVVKSDGEPKP